MVGELSALSIEGEAAAGRLSEGAVSGKFSGAVLRTGDDKIAPAVEGRSLVALNAAVGKFKVCELLLVRPCGRRPAAGASIVVLIGGRATTGALITVAMLLVLSFAEWPAATGALGIPDSAVGDPGIIST